MQIGENLKLLRKMQGLTQQELAEKTGIKQQNLSRWEKGIHLPDIAECIKLADFYEITLDELVDRDCNFNKTNIRSQCPPNNL